MEFPLTEKYAASTLDVVLKLELHQLLEIASNRKTIKSLISEFIKIAHTRESLLRYGCCVSHNVSEWLPEAIVVENPPPIGIWKSVDINGTNEEVMQQIAMTMSLSQAIVFFTEMVKNSEFDKENNCRIIFLNETRNDNSLMLNCCRMPSGILSLYLSTVFLGRISYSPSNMWFSINKSFKS